MAFDIRKHDDPQNPGNYWIFNYFEPGDDPCDDLEDDQAEQVRMRIEDGELIAFDVDCDYYVQGHLLGADSLSGCIYQSVDDFEQKPQMLVTDHATGQTADGSYFEDLKWESREQARIEIDVIRKLPPIQTEKTAKEGKQA